MPHINRIRVNNVKYNFGTQSYDDFVMRLSGKNTIYDLANGGGKSLLMLLALQNMLPNCTLDEKQPIEKLFRSGNDNTVIHSLVEWKLDASHIKNGFAYMTTGFCARKAKEHIESEEEERFSDVAAIEYFNYCIFYREFNANDIVNLPLEADGERVTFTGLKNYLRQLGKKDYSLQIKIFDKKGEYQRFISRYGIYESEWELIRGINKTEGHVRTFFESHYKTTRKVVEDLMIEEIIEKSYQNRLEQDENAESIAQTLLDIKDKLVELSKKKSEMEHFDHQMEAMRSFRDRLYSLQSLYQEKAEMENELAATYNTAQSQLAKLIKQRDETDNNIVIGQQKITETEKTLERSKIAVEEACLQDLEQETTALQIQNLQLEEEAANKERQLLLYEAGNDYFEYLENKKQMEIQKNVIFDLTSKNGDLWQELQALAGNLLRMERELQAQLEQKLNELEREKREKETACATLEIQTHELDKQQAILENECNELSILVQAKGEALEVKRQQSGLVIAEDAEKRIIHIKAQIQKLQEEEENENERFLELQTQILTLECQQSSNQQKRFSFEERLKEYRSLLRQKEKNRQKMKELQTVYEQEGEELYISVERALEQKIARLTVIQQQQESNRQWLEQLNNQTMQIKDKAINPILDYIRRHYDEQAMSGIEYLNALSEQERKECLEATPFLCHVILMQSSIEEAALDENLKLKTLPEQLLVLMPKDAVKADENLYDPKKLHLLSSDCAVFYNQEARAKEEKLSIAKRDELEAQIHALKVNIKLLQEDLFFLELNLHQENENEQSVTQKYEQLKTEYRQTMLSLEQFQGRKEKLQHRLNEAQSSIEQKKRQQKQLVQEVEILNELNRLYHELIETDKKALEKKELCQKIRQEFEEATAKHAREQSDLDNISKLVRNIEEKLAQSNEAILHYEPYEVNKEYPNILLEKSEMEQLFWGKEQAFKEKNSDVSDKQRMADLYRTAMEKNEASIKYRHFTVEDLEKRAQNHELRIMTIEELEQAKEQARRCQQRLTDAQKEQAHKQSQYDRQHGCVRHGVQAYEEKFQEEYHSLWQNADQQQTVKQLQLFIKDGAARLKEAKREAAQQLERVKQLEKQVSEQEAMTKELLHLIKNLDIEPKQHEERLSENEDLKQAYTKVRGNYDSLAAQESKCRESFEQDKAQLIQTLNLLKASDLAIEIGRQFKNPKDAQEAMQYIKSIEQTVQCINLEKSRIAQSIAHMELMKENFERQCLQICLSVREALERLPGLSTIQLDQKPTGMIRLSIPYIDETQYKDAIGRYIDKIVETADSLETQNERLKYIRGQLAWKRLFSVIVKDMAKVKLLLYKRERMKEQSRYLKYEEAVGSTGQSQGIYIQFLIAVINYISCLNGISEQSSLQKKTIFIDNPFGAAKDVYIWEPIFQMLKSNHVQMIVPARGASPAICSRFEVNYILGQKLINGRQQTVVADYRSQVEEEQLEYRKLEYTQPAFEFI